MTLLAPRSGLTTDTLETSSEAADGTADERRETQRRQVYETIADATAGRTDDEVQCDLGLDGNSERPRRWELWRQDKICILRDAKGNAVTRQTRTGRRAVVWIANSGQ